MTEPVLSVTTLSKHFNLHNQGGAKITVFDGLNLEVLPGEAVVLGGPSGAGKSTLMRAIYGNYLVQGGDIWINGPAGRVNVRTASPRALTQLRRSSMGYVSQFLRVIPRVDTLNLVMEPMLQRGIQVEEARQRAINLLKALNLPEGHWALPPATFSGGEQQRVNIARGFAVEYPLMLLDEPTASLDAGNKDIVIDLIKQRIAAGTSIVGIFHDQIVRDALDARVFDVQSAAFETL
ncbi:MAG: phosphonate C-P lyase system protein PhnL [Pseudomonadota bacterium]